jgi:hypothetical protein
MENQDHLLNTVGPMYLEELKKREAQQAQQPAIATPVDAKAAPKAAKTVRKAASKKTS